MKPNLVIGNWKMNGDQQANEVLLRDFLAGQTNEGHLEVAICPPFPYLASVAAQLKDSNVVLGAQNLSPATYGAFTGEVSASMLRDIGCRYVLVGHSERRALFGETDEVVAQKFAAAIEQGLTPVLCIGETLDERRAGITNSVVTTQMAAVIKHAGIEKLTRGVIAYEPVWAIGTGETASPEQAQAVHQHIRSVIGVFDQQTAIDIQILYGGSVKADNAQALFSQPDIDGGLIGGASLDAASFISICDAARTTPRGTP
ncbi:triose-phosphate isomerase [Pseudomonas sp. 21LCFQ010]|uniref:triose-phosphate isomerase n=1 Tax=Pseudomonas sp. 21LCFQ010 TaxID=2957506 RepID=UPI00209789FB|nr:triose-phosphate isomerase [Pseudomonas sp. 21LCFQ010]MCO8165429.1 triose-phosphate isomerase [Pseudomonas sp. 21LCFQ010]